jgi:hypothetical protein
MGVEKSARVGITHSNVSPLKNTEQKWSKQNPCDLTLVKHAKKGSGIE